LKRQKERRTGGRMGEEAEGEKKEEGNEMELEEKR
jgi:hypothetical protein